MSPPSLSPSFISFRVSILTEILCPECWTDWFDRDDPDGSGDWEKLADLRDAHPGKICPNPSDIEARTLSGLTAAEAGDLNTQ